MRSIATILILTIAITALGSVSPGQPPKGKKGSKGSQSPEALADELVNKMMAFDKNKDGKLTRDEVTDPRLLRLFDRADSNKDGVVTREELTALAKEIAAEETQGGGQGGFGPGDKGGFGPPGKGGFGKGGKGGFGKGGFGFGPPQPGQILAPFLRDMLKLTEDQKKQLDTLQNEVDAKLSKILTDDQKKQLKEMRGPGGFGPPGGPGGSPPPPPDGPGKGLDVPLPVPAPLLGRRGE
jgi:hypothetical protein